MCFKLFTWLICAVGFVAAGLAANAYNKHKSAVGLVLVTCKIIFSLLSPYQRTSTAFEINSL